MADKRYTMSRRGVSFAGMAMLVAALLPQIADAQSYPNRPVQKILVDNPARLFEF